MDRYRPSQEPVSHLVLFFSGRSGQEHPANLQHLQYAEPSIYRNIKSRLLHEGLVPVFREEGAEEWKRVAHSVDLARIVITA